MHAALAADMHHGTRSGNESWLADVVAFFFFLYNVEDEFGELLVARAAAHEFVKIVIPTRE